MVQVNFPGNRINNLYILKINGLTDIRKKN